jgi:hypothetical protein
MNPPDHCPHLPTPEARMSHRCLTDLKDAERAVFYHTALKYGHYLWQQGHSGRAILALTRALYADVAENDSILKQWPLPYGALKWIVANHSSTHFPGNPRISFQHQATRLRGDRQSLRRARAWAVWALICKARPELEPDRTQDIIEPTLEAIETQLHSYGHSGESELWRTVLLGILQRDTPNAD